MAKNSIGHVWIWRVVSIRILNQINAMLINKVVHGYDG